MPGSSPYSRSSTTVAGTPATPVNRASFLSNPFATLDSISELGAGLPRTPMAGTRPQNWLDGWWRTGEGEDVNIAGDQIKWPRGSTGVIRSKTDSQLETVIDSNKYMARLFSGKLHWSDGETWVRLEDTLLGSWKTGRGDTALISEDSVSWPRGSKGEIISKGPNSLQVRVDSEAYEATLVDAKLMWNDGDVWTRVPQADEDTYCRWLNALGVSSPTVSMQEAQRSLSYAPLSSDGGASYA